MQRTGRNVSMNILPPYIFIFAPFCLKLQLTHVLRHTQRPPLSSPSRTPFSPIFIFLHDDTQLSSFIRSRWPNQRNLPLLTTSNTSSTPTLLLNSSKLTLSANYTPHILLSVLSSLLQSSPSLAMSRCHRSTHSAHMTCHEINRV